MFTIKTEIKNSKIHGIGVFTLEFIPKGSIIWKFVENFDKKICQDQFEQLPDIAKEFYKFYGYYNESEGGWVLCMDNAKYTNHSLTPNMEMVNEVYSIATEDINIGDEITENYFVFDEKAIEKNIN